MILDDQDLVKEIQALMKAIKIKDLTTAVTIAVVEAPMSEATVIDHSVQHVMAATKMEIFLSQTSQDPWFHINSSLACKIGIFQICTNSTKSIRNTTHKTMRKLS